MNEVNVKIGTIVNGITIESHKAMQAKIADLLIQVERLQERCDQQAKVLHEEYGKELKPAIPDWIAPGKWIEEDFGKHQQYRIEKIVNNEVFFDRKINKFGEVEIPHQTLIASDLLEIGIMPFTPPPCPELPHRFLYYGEYVQFEGIAMPIEAWIAAANVMSKGKTKHDDVATALPDLIAVRDWREKWGEK